MIVFWIIFYIVFTLALAYVILTHTRNQKAHDYRISVINRIADQITNDLNRGITDVEWRWDPYLDGPGYNEMMLKFWKPFTDEAWYKDRSFLED